MAEFLKSYNAWPPQAPLQSLGTMTCKIPSLQYQKHIQIDISV